MDISGRTRRVIYAQLVVGVVLGTGMFFVFGSERGLGAEFGVLVGILLTLLLSRSVKRAADVAATDPKRGMTMLYIGAVQRFFFVLAAFAVGLAVFRLDPLSVAVGFVAAQLAQLVNAGSKAENSEEGLK